MGCGRSGNRGKCAQPCRLPYELTNQSETLDKGYLMSPRDLCGLDYLPQLIKAGVSCLKIEGRMKTPEYVATVTRIYRKYLDLQNPLSQISSTKLMFKTNKIYFRFSTEVAFLMDIFQVLQTKTWFTLKSQTIWGFFLAIFQSLTIIKAI